jgi:integrase
MSINQNIDDNNTISLSSKRTYKSIISGLSKRLAVKLESVNDLIQHMEKILTFMENLPYNSRKTRLSALLKILPDEYSEIKNIIRKQMLDDIKETNNKILENKKDDKQSKNWIDWKDVLKIYTGMTPKFNKMVRDKSLDDYEKMFLRNYVILSFFIHQEPRRSLDYVSMKLKPTKTENYIDMKNNTIVFNRYKTQKVYGTQNIPLNPSMKKILNVYIRTLPSTQEYLFIKDDKKMNSAHFTHILNGIFKKRFSVNNIRHSYLTHLYGEDFQNMKERASRMGHNIDTALEYIKK